jgi:hypothetical protein
MNDSALDGGGRNELGVRSCGFVCGEGVSTFSVCLGVGWSFFTLEGETYGGLITMAMPALQ